MTVKLQPAVEPAEAAFNQQADSHYHRQTHEYTSRHAGQPEIIDPLITSSGGLPSNLVITPPLEVQPWVKSFGRWFADNTRGVARVDLRRPQ